METYPTEESDVITVTVPTNDLREAQKAVSEALIAYALRSTDGNVSAAARRLGITRNTLRYKLETLGSEQFFQKYSIIPVLKHSGRPKRQS